MRTTVTLDPDVEAALKREIRRTGAPFKQVLNEAIRAGLQQPRRRHEPFRPLTFDLGRPTVDLTRALELAATLEDEELVRRHARVR